MCFSQILLSVDLSSPHVKNKMSKREFIRNTRGAVGAEGDHRDDNGVIIVRNHIKYTFLQLAVDWRKTFTAAFMTTFSSEGI